MTATIHRLYPSPAPIRCVDEAPPIRAHAEALMRMLVKDERIPRDELHRLADLLDPMIETMERV